MDLWIYAGAALAAYLLGSVPTGYWLARLKGIDIRTVGSGNIGATNVLRALGKPAGALVLVLDGLKGFAACAWLAELIGRSAAASPFSLETLRIVAGVAAILGHNYTFWLRFKGGKGIATSAGVLAALVPWALLIILAVWLLVLACSRYVSLASICASFTLPFATWLTGGSGLLIGVTAGLGALAIYKHKANIQRLWEGTESRFQAGRTEVAP